MAKPEQPRAIRFVDGKGNKNIASLNPKDYTLEELKEIAGSVIDSNLKGRPARIHIVFLEGHNILTEADFRKKRSPEELEVFKGICVGQMASSQKILILRNPQKVPTNLFTQFINEDLGMEY